MTVQGLRSAAVYNPAFWNEEELKQYFVARIEILNRILNDIAAEGHEASRKHRLILGQRGMGKTTLLRRIAVGVSESPNLSSIWLPLTFPEEQYNVAQLSDLWLNCLDALSDSLEESGERTAAKDLDRMINDIEAKPERALSLLIATSKSLKRRLILLVDNIDLIFERLKDEQWAMREVLQSEPQILFIGASARAVESTFKYDAAFYDFFKIDELHRLDLNETRNILLRLSEIENAPKVQNLLKTDMARIQTLHALTGGNPRTIVLLFNVLSRGLDGDVRSDLENLLDIATPLYKARFEELPVLSQQVVDALALHWDPATAHALSKAMSADVNKISAQLSRLEAIGLVEKVQAASGKRAAFQISERFFNIWYLMRASRRLRKKLIWLVHFLRMFFSAEELRFQARRHLFGPDRNYTRSAEFAMALAQAVQEKAMRAALENHALQTLLRDKRYRGRMEVLFDLQGEDATLLPRVERMKKCQELQVLLKDAFGARIDEYATFDHHFTGSPGTSLQEKEKFVRAAKAVDNELLARRQRELNEEWEYLSRVFGTLAEKLYAAIASGQMATATDIEGGASAAEGFDEPLLAAFPWYLRVGLPRPLSETEQRQAEVAIQDALLLEPERAWIVTARACLLGLHMQRPQEAERLFRKAAELDPSYTSPWASLGKMLLNTKNFGAAEDAFRRAIQADPTRTYSWYRLAEVYETHLNEPGRAVAVYRDAMAANPDDVSLLWSFANLLARIDRINDAVPLARRAAELECYDELSWRTLAAFLQKYEIYRAEAARAFEKALSLEPRSSDAWNEFGWFLTNYERKFDKAEAAFNKSVEYNQKNISPWLNLAYLHGYLTDRPDAAAREHQHAIELDPKNSYSWTQFADFLVKHEEFKRAEDICTEAIERVEKPVGVWIALGNVRAYSLKKPEEAEHAFRKALEADPKSTAAWTCLGYFLGVHRNRLDEGERVYREAIQADVDDADRWTQFGIFLQLRTGRSAESESAFRKAIELKPNNKDAWSGLASLLAEDVSRSHEAEITARKVVSLSPEAAWAWGTLGVILAERAHKFEEAADVMRKSVELLPHDSNLWNNLGFVLANLLNNFDDGEAAYRKSIEVDSKNPFPLNNLADLLMHHLEKREEAELAYHRAEQLGITNLQSLAIIARSHIMSADNWTFAERHIARLIDTGSNYDLEEAWRDVILTFKEALAAGRGAEALNLIDSTVAHERWRPLREAIAAILSESPTYLNGIAPEVRETSLKIAAQLSTDELWSLRSKRN